MTNSAQEMKDGSQAGAKRSPHVANAMEEQKKALEALGAQTKEMKDKIQQANREIEQVMKLMADVETFKMLYMEQKHLTRETKSFSEVEAQDLETRVRLKELGGARDGRPEGARHAEEAVPGAWRGDQGGVSEGRR